MKIITQVIIFCGWRTEISEYAYYHKFDLFLVPISPTFKMSKYLKVNPAMEYRQMMVINLNGFYK